MASTMRSPKPGDPKLTVKKALRGGVVPKVVRDYTNDNILKAEDETKEEYQA